MKRWGVHSAALLEEKEEGKGRCCSSKISTSRVSEVESRVMVEREVMRGWRRGGIEGIGMPIIFIVRLLLDLLLATARFCCLISHSWTVGWEEIMVV